MIQLYVLYPASSRFDFDYYKNKHLPMLRELWGPVGMESVTASKGVSGLFPGTPAKYTAMAILTFTSGEALQKALKEGGGQVISDIANYTDAQPELQLCEAL